MKPFLSFFRKNKSETSAAAGKSETSVASDQSSGFDSLSSVPFAGDPNAAKKPASETTYDDLASVPFAGDPRMRLAMTEEETAHDKTPDAPEEVSDEAEPTADKDTERGTEEAEREPSPELQAFREFFATDLRIKREMMSAAPRPTDLHSEEGCMDYVDDAYKSFRSLRHDFLRLEKILGHTDYQHPDRLHPNTERFFQRGEQAFALSRYDASTVKRLYNDEFAQLRPDFVERVKDECCGYTIMSNPEALYGEAASVNELLHAHHSAFLNNERNLQGVPEVAQKQIAGGEYSVSLRGEDTELGRDVFDAFTEDFDAGRTDIVALDNKVLMMVRDRGHALTIDADLDPKHPDEVWVQYHIPKICHRPMIEALPGIGKVTEMGADGRFAVPRAEFGAKIVDFIGQVPTDEDMFKPGGPAYRGEDTFKPGAAA